jgi:hypothetical protein
MSLSVSLILFLSIVLAQNPNNCPNGMATEAREADIDCCVSVLPIDFLKPNGEWTDTLQQIHLPCGYCMLTFPAGYVPRSRTIHLDEFVVKRQRPLWDIVDASKGYYDDVIQWPCKTGNCYMIIDMERRVKCSTRASKPSPIGCDAQNETLQE